MLVRLTKEQMDKIVTAKDVFNKKYAEAYNTKVKALVKVNDEQSELRKELEELRKKEAKLEEQINDNLKDGLIKANADFSTALAKAKKEYTEEVNKIYAEAMKNSSGNMEDPFESLLKTILGIEFDNSKNEDKQSNTEKELTEDEMIEYIMNAELHTVARLYYNLADLKVIQIRKERMCESCGKQVEPYKYMVMTNRYYDKATLKTFSEYWDENSEVTNNSGVIEVVDQNTGEVITLAKKVMYSEIKCAYAKVKEAEKLTEEIKKIITGLIDIGYREI